MTSVASLEKIEIIRSQEFMPREARLKFLKKMIILGPKTAILGPQFCRILVLGPHIWWSGMARAPRPPLDPPPFIIRSSPMLPLVRSFPTVLRGLTAHLCASARVRILWMILGPHYPKNNLGLHQPLFKIS